MFVWWLAGSIGWFCVSIIYCQDNTPILAGTEPDQNDGVQAAFPSLDNPSQIIANDTNNLAEDEGIGTTTIALSTTQLPELFSCHQCTNCNSESDFVTTVCETGITMCYKMHKRIDNTSQIIIRGCSTSKEQCTVPNDDQSNSLDSITCCTGHKCNQANQFNPLLFLSIFSLISILNT